MKVKEDVNVSSFGVNVHKGRNERGFLFKMHRGVICIFIPV